MLDAQTGLEKQRDAKGHDDVRLSSGSVVRKEQSVCALLGSLEGEWNPFLNFFCSLSRNFRTQAVDHSALCQIARKHLFHKKILSSFVLYASLGNHLRNNERDTFLHWFILLLDKHPSGINC